MTWEILLIEDSSYVCYTVPKEVILYSLNKNIFIIVKLVRRVPDLMGSVCSSNWSKLPCVRLAYSVA
jgi:hypothetical protein